MDASREQLEQAHITPSSSSTVSQFRAPIPEIPDRLFECPLLLPSRQQHDPRVVAEQPIFPGKKVFLVLSKNETISGQVLAPSPPGSYHTLASQSLGVNTTTKPTVVPQILVLAGFGREDLANVYVDEFIKHYTPSDEDEIVDRDARDHDRKQFLKQIKDSPLSVVDAYGEEVTSSNAPDAPEVYKVEDEQGKMTRFIWVDISWVEVPEGQRF